MIALRDSPSVGIKGRTHIGHATSFAASHKFRAFFVFDLFFYFYLFISISWPSWCEPQIGLFITIFFFCFLFFNIIERQGEKKSVQVFFFSLFLGKGFIT